MRQHTAQNVRTAA